MVGDGTGTRFAAKAEPVRLSEEYLARRHTGEQRPAEDGRTLVGGATLTAWWTHLSLPAGALTALLEHGEVLLSADHAARVLAWLPQGPETAPDLGFIHDHALRGLSIHPTEPTLRLTTSPARPDHPYHPVVTLTAAPLTAR
ncbi:hypothetical protein [Streptomyces sp. NPDC089919]|uniref:hypothetical protein n=1 Tax=Streptomyces sp. NPDC089919 TaxID=3155188 RepID=UPI00343B50B5